MISIIVSSFLLFLFGFFNIIGIKPGLFLNQLTFFLIALGVYLITRKIGRHFFRINSATFYWFFVTILIVTFLIGLEVKGSKRWINLYFFNFQGSEFFKVIFILFMASYLSHRLQYFNRLHVFLTSLIYFAIPFFIIFKQPDLGNSLVLAFIFVTMVLFSDIPKKYLLYLIVTSLLTLPFGWFILKPYQKERILSFIWPQLDQQGTAYNMIQAMITVGSGKFFGRGLGLGTQSRLYFLPENHTDFAFSSLVEQFGFLGGFFVILLYSIIFFALIKKVFKFYYMREDEAKENFLYLIGFLSYLTFQFIVNIGMNLGLLPIAGIALPFISYGGSSLVALMFGMALIP